MLRFARRTRRAPVAIAWRSWRSLLPLRPGAPAPAGAGRPAPRPGPHRRRLLRALARSSFLSVAAARASGPTLDVLVVPAAYGHAPSVHANVQLALGARAARARTRAGRPAALPALDRLSVSLLKTFRRRASYRPANVARFDDPRPGRRVLPGRHPGDRHAHPGRDAARGRHGPRVRPGRRLRRHQRRRRRALPHDDRELRARIRRRDRAAAGRRADRLGRRRRPHASRDSRSGPSARSSTSTTTSAAGSGAW